MKLELNTRREQEADNINAINAPEQEADNINAITAPEQEADNIYAIATPEHIAHLNKISHSEKVNLLSQKE